MLLEDLAKDLVDVTSQMIGGRTINIMNPSGYIIASTERTRIGSFHQGALEAVRTGKVVIIEKDQVDRYPGAREGYNMPLRVNGSIIGAIGISGEPQEVQYLAHLLEVYATKSYQVEAMLRSRLAAGELRGRVLRALLSKQEGAQETAAALMQSLQLTLEYPVTVVLVSPPDRVALSDRQEALVRSLSQQRLLRHDRDVWGTVDDSLVLIVSGADSPAAQRKPEFLAALADYRVSFGELCPDQPHIPVAYHQAKTLDLAAHQMVNDAAQVEGRTALMLSITANEQGEYLDRLYDKLTAAFRVEERHMLLTTARTYYDMGRSVGKAAGSLFIHKNTLQYRIRRLLEVLELTKCTPFQQEYLIRLLLERFDR